MAAFARMEIHEIISPLGCSRGLKSDAIDVAWSHGVGGGAFHLDNNNI